MSLTATGIELAGNPLREGLRMSRVPEPCVFVIFGATGDLTRRKIMPSLYRLFQARLLPSGFSVLGVAGRELSTEDYHRSMREAVEKYGGLGPINQSLWESFAQGITYYRADLEDSACYDELESQLVRLAQERSAGNNIIFYMAIPPSLFQPVISNLGNKKMARAANNNGRWVRVIIEKPFGRDLESACQLNRLIAEFFDEEQIYRIDHYLGKDTVQNIAVLRFANIIFEPIWNRRYIDHFQITVAESIGIEGRSQFYEEAGAVRDIIQNHGLQLLSLIAMEPPAFLDAQSVRDEKIKVLRSIQPIQPSDVDLVAVRGQYGAGIIDGRPVPGYRQEPEVSPDSQTETYAAVKFEVSNWRWEGVPFYVRTGKRLARRVTEIAVQFKPVPHVFFRPTPVNELVPNTLVMRIQPDEGVSIKLESKLPGLSLRLRPVTMDFRYLTAFGTQATEAYDRLLLDCMLGDPTLFARRDQVEVAWELVDPILETWEQIQPDFPNYEAGSWGPQAADELMQRDGRKWRRL